jgi:hypothetical protein
MKRSSCNKCIGWHVDPFRLIQWSLPSLPGCLTHVVCNLLIVSEICFFVYHRRVENISKYFLTPKSSSIQYWFYVHFLSSKSVIMSRGYFIVFICYSLNNAASSSDCTASNSRITGEYWIGKDVEGRSHDLIWDTVPAFSWKDWISSLNLAVRRVRLQVTSSVLWGVLQPRFCRNSLFPPRMLLILHTWKTWR